MNMHILLTNSPMPSVCEQPSIRQLSYLYQSQIENISGVARLAKSIEACGTIKRWHWRFLDRIRTGWGNSHWLWLISRMMTKILSRYDELFFLVAFSTTLLHPVVRSRLSGLDHCFRTTQIVASSWVFYFDRRRLWRRLPLTCFATRRRKSHLLVTWHLVWQESNCYIC